MGISVQSIAEQLKTNNRDTDRKPIPELGFSLGAWNGDNDSPASLSITSGCYEERVRNAVLLSFQAPPPSDDAARGALRRLVEKSVAAWDPDHAVATSTEFLDRKGARIPWEIGWVTYQRGGTIEIHPY